jgi:hypothetical protein
VSRPRLVALAALSAAFALARAPDRAAAAEPPPSLGVPAARGPADVYERGRTSLKDALTLVVRDLRTRAEAWTPRAAGRDTGGVLVLVLDPTTSNGPSMTEVRDALDVLAKEGPRGLRIGVWGAATESVPPGTAEAARHQVDALLALPLDGPKNLLAAVREAAESLPLPATEPRALVLVTRDGGDAEDDVEATRRTLLDRGVVFHSVAPEAAFERPWDYDFVAKTVADLGLTQRFNPAPRVLRPGELYQGGDVAFGLVPYDWEFPGFPLAQTQFSWGGPGLYPVPSGFGFWCLATLSWSTGGKCFVHNFRAPGARSTAQDRHLSLYDMGFLNLFAPDLRTRAEILKALAGMRRARTLVRIWDHLSAEEAPVVRDHGTLEIDRGGLAARPAIPVRSAVRIATVFRDHAQVERALEIALDRRARVEEATSWWVDDARRETTTVSDGSLDPLRQRVEADFDLLGFQLVKVRFHWGEVIAALESIRPEDFQDDRVEIRLVSRVIARGAQTVGAVRLPDATRMGALVAVTASARRIVTRYHSTPWALVVDKGEAWTVDKVLREVPPPQPPSPGRPTAAKPPAPRPAPAPGPRPSSGPGGDTTGGK